MFPRECTETFQEGHCRAFQFFGGVPTRISYDNSRIAVAKFVGRRGDTPTREFLRLESHFLFEHHFCLVRRANEKGHVEGLIGFARRNFMVPIPRVADLEEFNEQSAQCCRADLDRRLRGQPTTKQGLLEQEQQSLLPLPALRSRNFANHFLRFSPNWAIDVKSSAQQITAQTAIVTMLINIRASMMAELLRRIDVRLPEEL